MPVQSDMARAACGAQQCPRHLPDFDGQSGFGCTHPSCERRHSGQGRCPELKHTDAANNRGVGEWEPRGAAGGAAFHRSRRSAYEPSPTQTHPPQPHNCSPPSLRFGPASRSYVTASEVHTDSNHSTAMARSLGSSMARGLGILLIMMTLSEIAATRARRRLANKQQPHPHEPSPRAPPPLRTARRSSSAGRGDDGNERGQRRRGDARDAPPHLTTTQAPNLMKTTGPFILLLPAFVRSSRRSGLVLMMSPMPTRRPSGPRPLP